MASRDIYPIGQQDFKILRENGALYVDKTQFIDKLVTSQSQYYFLARPRRFGKSLFLSTLRYFFEGERQLFTGLHIDSTDWGWEKHPVLYIDLNSGEYTKPNNLDVVIDNLLNKWEEKYDVNNYDRTGMDISTRFGNILAAAHNATGRQVVILVDEYDKPLIKNLDREGFEEHREKLAALYSNFKSCAQHIRMVFLTGVSRFSKLSVFSGMNNLKDITFSNEFADICGITEQELSDHFKFGISELAEEYNVSTEEAQARLKKNYDGYRFAANGSDIYNPWSLLNCFSGKKISFYWNETGFPTIVAKALKRVNADLAEYFDTYCSESDLKGLDLTDPNPIALMYQTGYLTIKEFDRELNMYHLGIPNEEVKDGLVNVLIPYYARYKSEADAAKVKDMMKWIKLGRADDFMRSVQTYFAGVSYKLKMENENNFQNALFLVTNLLGLESDAEVETSDGRIDMLIKTTRYIYIIELKYDKSAEEALAQINSRRYDRPYSGDHRKIIKIGVNFSSKTRTIGDWLIEEES